MLSALILVISTALLAQFGLFYWRALMASYAAAPLSERVWQASGLACEGVERADFSLLMNVNSICPDLQEKSRSTAVVSMYFRALAALRRISQPLMPSLAAWSEREMGTCARYVAVVVDQRLKGNGALAAEVCSY